jgi:hypothetical protein
MGMAFTPSTDPKEIDRRLSRSYWFVTHRTGIVKVLMLVLAAFDLALFGVAAFVLVDWAVGGGRSEARSVAALAQTFTDFASFRERNQPRDLVVEGGQVLPVGDGMYDVVIPISNPNTRWWARMRYGIGSATEGSLSAAPEEYEAYLLPGETKYLYRLGISSQTRPAATADVRSIEWFSLNNKIVQPDYATWSGERLRVTTSDAAFASADSEGSPVSRATFKVTNDTAFGYKRVGFFVQLMGGGRVVGFNHVTATDFRPGETRELSTAWYVPIGGVTRVIVQPEVNIFDPANAIAPGN